ncbi:MAG: O-antigen ligase family protein [Gammaproteobacteria bacterium]
MAVSPATIGVAVSVFAIVWLIIHRTEIDWRVVAVNPFVILFSAVAGFGVLSALWAVNPDLAVMRAWKFLAVLLPLALLARPCTRFATGQDAYPRALLFGIWIAAILLLTQSAGGFLIRGWNVDYDPHTVAIKLNVPVAAIAILVWIIPACWHAASARGGRLLAGTAGVMIVVAAILGDGLAPRVAIAIGAAAWLSAHYRPRTTAVGIVALTITAHVATLVVVPKLYQSSPFLQRIEDRSILHRLDVWGMVGDLIRERPLLGYGFDNSRAIPPRTEISAVTGTVRSVPMYPHNALLQAQLELGVVGIAGFYGCLLYLLRKSIAMPRVARASALAMVASSLSIWYVGYPLWRSTWIAWLAFCAIAASAISASEDACCE